MGNLTKQKKTVFIVDLCELLFQMSLKYRQKDFSLTGFTGSTSFIILTDSIKFSGSLFHYILNSIGRYFFGGETFLESILHPSLDGWDGKYSGSCP